MTLYRLGSAPNRKKNRGRKRHACRLAQLSTAPGALALKALQERHYTYEKLGLGPWHWHHRQPPRAIRQLAVQHLLTTFLAWQPTLAALHEPVYSAVWIIGPEFAHSSQIVAAVRERISWYASCFAPFDPKGPPLPAEYHALPGANQLTWATHPHEQWHAAYAYPTGWPIRYLRRPHRFYTAEDGEQHLAVQTGWTWVGRLPAAPSL